MTERKTSDTVLEVKTGIFHPSVLKWGGGLAAAVITLGMPTSLVLATNIGDSLSGQLEGVRTELRQVRDSVRELDTSFRVERAEVRTEFNARLAGVEARVGILERLIELHHPDHKRRDD